VKTSHKPVHEQTMNENLNIAVHEAGHSVAASFHFKIPAYPEILNEGSSVATQTRYPDYAGLCSYDDGPISKFQLAAISWSGMLAQCLYAEPPTWMPPFKPSRLMLRHWHGMAMVQIKLFSEGDRAGILGYRDTWRACKSAFSIVRKNRPQIIRLAKALAAVRVEKPVPMPEAFPASYADFLHLVVAADGIADPEAQLRAYLYGLAEKFLAQPQFALGREQHRQAVESWTTAQLAKFQTGFTNAELWRDAARAFKAWSTAKAKTHPIKSYDKAT
jgi:hypothetical protein